MTDMTDSDDTITNLDDGTVIVQKSDGRFIVESWGTVQVKDKEGQELPVQEVVDDIPFMMKYRPEVHLGHSDTQLGPVLDVKKAVKETKKGSRDAVRVKYEIRGGRRYLEAARKGVLSGKYGAVSLKGYSFGRPTYKQDEEGMTEVPHDLEVCTFALCRKGMNPESTHITLNGKEFSKEDDDALTSEPEFIEHMRKLLHEGMSYTQALSTIKEMYTGGLIKELVKEYELDKEIHERDGKWVVTSEGGKKVLGTHSTKEKALAQLRAVEANKRNHNKGDTDITDIDANNLNKGVVAMAELEEIQKELDKLKELNKSLTDKNSELESKIAELTKDKEETPESEGNTVDKEETLTKEDVVALLKEQKEELTKEIRDELLKDKDSLVEMLGLQKMMPEQGEDSSAKLGLIKKNDAGVEEVDAKKFYELFNKGREETYNETLDDIPDIEKSTKEMWGE